MPMIYTPPKLTYPLKIGLILKRKLVFQLYIHFQGQAVSLRDGSDLVVNLCLRKAAHAQSHAGILT